MEFAEIYQKREEYAQRLPSEVNKAYQNREKVNSGVKNGTELIETIQKNKNTFNPVKRFEMLHGDVNAK